jgi:hypothetical protein
LDAQIQEAIQENLELSVPIMFSIVLKGTMTLDGSPDYASLGKLAGSSHLNAELQLAKSALPGQVRLNC